MKKAPYICLYLSYLHILEPLSDAIRGKLMMAMLQYAQTGEQPRLTGHAKLLWPGFQDQIDRDLKRYQDKCAQNKINGAKGGRPPKTEHNPSVPENPKEKEMENEKETEKENAKEKETSFTAPGAAEAFGAPPSFSPPDLHQVEDYVKSTELSIDPVEFWDHYTSNGWMVGRSPMRDWKAAARGWNRKEHQYGKTDLPMDDCQYGTVL